MCQYHRKCPVGRHRPGTRCPYLRNRIAAGAALVLIVVVSTVAVTGWNPTRTSSSDKAGEEGQRPRQTGARIVRIIDGDTVMVRAGGNEVRVRVLGIDTPEIAHGQEPAECFGDEAAEQLTKLAPPGTKVVLVGDDSQGNMDQYERWLRYVEVVGGDRLDVGAELVRSGAAEVYDAEPDARRESAYRELQAAAKTDERGQWGTC